jgi:hypothetical protein
MKKYLLLPVLVLFAVAARAQSADSLKSPVRTLTYQQYIEYKTGAAGMDLAYVAEVHHYPMPDKVLRFKKELGLSAEQIATISEANTHMHKLRVQVGGSIIDNEKTLDLLFAQNNVDSGNLIFYINRYGLYQGELRTAILQACIVTKKTLTPEQMNKFDNLQKPD